ncbi:regulatory protein RecX [Sediminitomix flava]|uniref:Regulatory protein RecX n=1 Tax=Sediminitomix flava TaxID=379075 RepID=A0A315ZBC4_SEDFL|nr:regulatory protein RecX [Sediminitomix flava]PWJ42363.1 regulatory protein [Sediminitomix flava]
MYQKYQREYSYKELLHKAASYSAYQDRSVFDVEQKLKTWNASEDDINKILDKLISEKYLDEERFALSFARGKLKGNKWGKRKISIALQQKKIGKTIIQKALSSLDAELYWDILIKVSEQKWNSLAKEKDERVKKYKLLQFLLGRGFESDLNQEAYLHLLNTNNDE